MLGLSFAKKAHTEHSCTTSRRRLRTAVLRCGALPRSAPLAWHYRDTGFLPNGRAGEIQRRSSAGS